MMSVCECFLAGTAAAHATEHHLGAQDSEELTIVDEAVRGRNRNRGAKVNVADLAAALTHKMMMRISIWVEPCRPGSKVKLVDFDHVGELCQDGIDRSQ